MYTFLVAVLLFFWTNIYIVVSKPEKIGTIGKKIARFMSSARWRVKQLQRQKSVACAAPLKTRYRTLTVYKSGYSRLARCVYALCMQSHVESPPNLKLVLLQKVKQRVQTKQPSFILLGRSVWCVQEADIASSSS